MEQTWQVWDYHVLSIYVFLKGLQDELKDMETKQVC